MKVTLDKDLCLKVIAENDVESVALKHWLSKFPSHLFSLTEDSPNLHDFTSTFIVDGSLEE